VIGSREWKKKFSLVRRLERFLELVQRKSSRWGQDEKKRKTGGQKKKNAGKHAVHRFRIFSYRAREFET
jgi:hypothetical protein